ncbi:Major facilitator superfamily multidrug-resistance DHA1 sub-family [Mycena kentingensis (nom. inval.)]|nr:Major facilitator superfamily multidrug-resistance DHA1 sub-family [Mycena kentingensis (nom. inval.)]
MAPDARQVKRTPLPKGQVAILLFIQLSEPITALVIYPFIMQFIRDLGITGGDESKTAHFAGIIESVFFLAELLLFGPLGLALAMLGFGLSKRFWTLVAFRCMQGAFNGNIGVSKSVMAEVRRRDAPPRPTAATPKLDLRSHKHCRNLRAPARHVDAGGNNRACGRLWVSTVSLNSSRPYIGGTFANPAERFPEHLGRITLLREYPYFLPCAMAGAIAFSVFVFGAIGLKETLPAALAKQSSVRQGTETQRLLGARGSGTSSSSSTLNESAPPPMRDMFMRPVLVALSNHAILCFCQMSYDVLIPLVYATPIDLGGLGLSPLWIGRIMGLAGLLNVFMQTFLSAKLIRRVGPRALFLTTFTFFPMSFLAYPLLNRLARAAGGVDFRVSVVIAAQLSTSFVMFATFACSQIYLVDSAPTQSSLGVVNGLAQMVSATTRSFAPSIAASLFALSVSHNILGGYFVFFFLAFASVCGFCIALSLPRKLRAEIEAECQD